MIFWFDLFDIINNISLAWLISENKILKIIYDFIDMLIPLKHCKEIIIDLKECYGQIRLFKQIFFSVYRKYLIFLEKLFFGKLESTNNKL